MRSRVLTYSLILLVMATASRADQPVPQAYRCGIAVGFPPYQYTSPEGRPAGMDFDVARLVFKEAGLEVTFVQNDWDDLLFTLAHRTGDIDLLCGTEASAERQALFDFSEPYYMRHITVFVLESSPISSKTDLYGKIVAGDRHSFIERQLGADRNRIRIKSTASKEESFIALRNGTVAAVIAPDEVGRYICRTMKLKVKTLPIRDPGSPVAFAVAKGNTELLSRINDALRRLKRRGEIEKTLQKHR